MVTGASIWEAGAVALIEPAVNSVWFYVLHKLWKSMQDELLLLIISFTLLFVVGFYAYERETKNPKQK